MKHDTKLILTEVFWSMCIFFYKSVHSCFCFVFFSPQWLCLWLWLLQGWFLQSVRVVIVFVCLTQFLLFLYNVITLFGYAGMFWFHILFVSSFLLCIWSRLFEYITNSLPPNICSLNSSFGFTLLCELPGHFLCWKI